MAKVIIAGGRDIEWVNISGIILDAIYHLPINSIYEIDEVVNGNCPSGIDKLAREWARKNNIKVKLFSPNWSLYGPAAGPRRNREMAEYIGKEGFLLAVWDGKSKGTKNMIGEAKKLSIPTYIERV